MTVPRVLITGANGMLGRALVDAWRDVFLVSGASGTTRREGWWVGSLTEPEAAKRLIDWAAPDLVVHTAGWTDVDGCERDPARASAVNATATGELAAATRAAGATFVYISTSAVFDGRDGGYGEDATPNPINVYGRTKLAGERASGDAHPDGLIVRVSLEGWRPGGRPSFIQWVVEGLGRGEARSICTDWIHSIVFASNLPEVIEHLWRSRASGVFHVGAPSPMSNWQLALRAADVFSLDRTLLAPIVGDSLQLAAKRPGNCSLRTIRPGGHADAVWTVDEGLARLRAEVATGQWSAA